MPHKPQVLDYETVTRSGMPGSFGRDESDQFPEASWPQSHAHQEPDTPTEGSTRRSAPPQGQTSWRARTILKRGHGISFAGLLLFTVILYFRPYELFSSLAWTSSSAFVVAVFTLVIYVPTQLGLEGNLTIRPKEINYVLLLLVAALLSVPRALDRTAAWNTFTDFLKVVLMFIVMVNVVRTEKRLKSLILLALIVSCILSASAVNDYRLGRLLLLGRNERIQGLIGNLFENPNDLALHLVTMIPLAVGLLLSSRGGLKKLFYAACAVLFVAGVVATFSRGGFIGMAFATGLLAWRLAKRNKWLIATCLPIALTFFVLFAPGGYGTRLGTTADESGLARFDELKRSLVIAVHHPLIGVGMNNYVNYSNFEHATHNAYTQVASEMGFPAMVVYILFLFAPLKVLRRIGRETSATRRSSRFYYLAVGLEASLFGYMVASFFLSVAYLWYVYYLVGYAMCFGRLYQASQTSTDVVRGAGGQDRSEIGSRVLVQESAQTASVSRL